MKARSMCQAHAKLIVLTLLLIPLIVILGCQGDSGYKSVDFSKTVTVSQPHSKSNETATLRVAVAAMVSPKETFTYYRELLDYIGNKLGYHVQMIQRKTYEEINEMFPKRQIDIAFICTGPYAVGKKVYRFEALATPVVRGKPFYYSYLIVNDDSTFKSFDNLRGYSFAFTDPNSNSGTLVPRFWLSQIGDNPNTFFKNTTYTYSHDNSILAVAKSLVDGATVDSHIWEYYNKRNPYYTSKTRVIKKSEPFGSPPIVASIYLPEHLKQQIKQLLFSMHNDPDGRNIMNELLIDQFVEPKEEWYQSVQDMFYKVRSKENFDDATKNS